MWMSGFGSMAQIRPIQTADLEKNPEYYKDTIIHGDMIDIARYKNLLNAISNITLKGYFLEFGVFQGKTINFVAERISNDQLIYGFDSWQGIPDDWHISQSLMDPEKSIMFKKGSWSANGSLPNVKPNVRLISGLFEESLPNFCQEHFTENNITSYLHVDCDLYSSTKTVFDFIGRTLASGSVIVFDEYHATGHEDRAFKEWLIDSKNTATMISTTTSGQCVFIID